MQAETSLEGLKLEAEKERDSSQREIAELKQENARLLQQLRSTD
jgi:hypothetical protein